MQRSTRRSGSTLPSLEPAGSRTTRGPRSTFLGTNPEKRSQPCLQLLARGPEQYLVYVHLLRLAHRIGNCLRERLGRNCDLLIELLDALGDVWLGNAVRQLGRDRAGRDHLRPDIAGLRFLAQSFG